MCPLEVLRVVPTHSSISPVSTSSASLCLLCLLVESSMHFRWFAFLPIKCLTWIDRIVSRSDSTETVARHGVTLMQTAGIDVCQSFLLLARGKTSLLLYAICKAEHLLAFSIQSHLQVISLLLSCLLKLQCFSTEQWLDVVCEIFTTLLSKQGSYAFTAVQQLATVFTNMYWIVTLFEHRCKLVL